MSYEFASAYSLDLVARKMDALEEQGYVADGPVSIGFDYDPKIKQILYVQRMVRREDYGHRAITEWDWEEFNKQYSQALADGCTPIGSFSVTSTVFEDGHGNQNESFQYHALLLETARSLSKMKERESTDSTEK